MAENDRSQTLSVDRNVLCKGCLEHRKNLRICGTLLKWQECRVCEEMPNLRVDIAAFLLKWKKVVPIYIDEILAQRIEAQQAQDEAINVEVLQHRFYVASAHALPLYPCRSDINEIPANSAASPIRNCSSRHYFRSPSVRLLYRIPRLQTGQQWVP